MLNYQRVHHHLNHHTSENHFEREHHWNICQQYDGNNPIPISNTPILHGPEYVILSPAKPWFH